jgi:hypothetical protein
MNNSSNTVAYCCALLLFLALSACEEAALPSEQVPITTTVDNEPRPPIPQPATSEVPPPSPRVENAPLTPVATPNSPPTSGKNGTMTMENLDNVQVTLDVNRLLRPEQLLFNVQNSIIPIYKNWVLFKNGTYVIIDDISNVSDVAAEAMRLLDAYRPETILNTPNANYSISHLDKAEGWSVYGNGYGIYTYVHPSEMVEVPSPPSIIVFSKKKRALDEIQRQIIYISSAEGVRPY